MVKIEVKKGYTTDDGETFETLVQAQRHLLVAWFGGDDRAEILADSIISHPDDFREVSAPFLVKRRGPRKKADDSPQLALEPGGDGEPQVTGPSDSLSAADMKASKRKAA